MDPPRAAERAESRASDESKRARAEDSDLTSRAQSDSDLIGGGDFDDLINGDGADGFSNITAEQGEVELGSYALPKRPRSLHNHGLKDYVRRPAPPSRTDYSAHGHMASKSLRSRIGYTVALLKCAARDCALGSPESPPRATHAIFRSTAARESSRSSTSTCSCGPCCCTSRCARA